MYAGELYCICGCMEFPIVPAKKIIGFIKNELHATDNFAECCCYNVKENIFNLKKAMKGSYGDSFYNSLAEVEN